MAEKFTPSPDTEQEKLTTAEAEKEILDFIKKQRHIRESKVAKIYDSLPFELRQYILDKSRPDRKLPLPAEQFSPEEEEEKTARFSEEGRIRLMEELISKLKMAELPAGVKYNPMMAMSFDEETLGFYRQLMANIWSNRSKPAAEYVLPHEEEFSAIRQKGKDIHDRLMQARAEYEKLEKDKHKTKAREARLRGLSIEIQNLKDENLPYALGEQLSRSPIKTEREEAIKTEIAAALAEYLTADEFVMAINDNFDLSNGWRKDLINQHHLHPEQELRFYGKWVDPKLVEEWDGLMKEFNEMVTRWHEEHKNDQALRSLGAESN